VLAGRVIDVRGRQILHLLRGDVEVKSVRTDPSHRGTRDEHCPAAQQVALPEEHKGHAAGAGIDDDPLEVPDVAVLCVHVLTARHLVLSTVTTCAIPPG
jgi:hypothetical protein